MEKIIDVNIRIGDFVLCKRHYLKDTIYEITGFTRLSGYLGDSHIIFSDYYIRVESFKAYFHTGKYLLTERKCKIKTKNTFFENYE